MGEEVKTTLIGARKQPRPFLWPQQVFAEWAYWRRLLFEDSILYWVLLLNSFQKGAMPMLFLIGLKPQNHGISHSIINSLKASKFQSFGPMYLVWASWSLVHQRRTLYRLHQPKRKGPKASCFQILFQSVMKKPDSWELVLVRCWCWGQREEESFFIFWRWSGQKKVMEEVGEQNEGVDDYVWIHAHVASFEIDFATYCRKN